MGEVGGSHGVVSGSCVSVETLLVDKFGQRMRLSVLLNLPAVSDALDVLIARHQSAFYRRLGGNRWTLELVAGLREAHLFRDQRWLWLERFDGELCLVEGLWPLASVGRQNCPHLRYAVVAINERFDVLGVRTGKAVARGRDIDVNGNG